MARSIRPFSAAHAALAGFALFSASSAAATSALATTAMVHPMVSLAAIEVACPTAAPVPLNFAAANPTTPAASKSAAILGGEMSALDRIKLQQSGAAAPEQAQAVLPRTRRMEPAASNIRPAKWACGAQSAQYSATIKAPQFATARTDDFLASKRVNIGKTSFDRDWNRVGRGSKRGLLKAALPSNAAPSRNTIEAVNSWVNREISYVEDRQLFGRADYWAGAGLTMALRKGDCEDIALTKMQMLAEAGIPRSDMFLTIARDTVRRADHALLIIRTDDGFVVLDNTTDQLLDGAYSHDYVPVLSFSEGSSWVHGY